MPTPSPWDFINANSSQMDPNAQLMARLDLPVQNDASINARVDTNGYPPPLPQRPLNQPLKKPVVPSPLSMSQSAPPMGRDMKQFQNWQSILEQSPSIQQAKSGIDQLQQLADDKAKYSPSQMDLSPLMALADSVTGSNIQKGYTPKTFGPAADALMAYQQQIQDAKNKVASTIATEASANMRNEAMMARLGMTQGTRQEGLQMKANSAYDHTIGQKYEDRLDAANRVKDLLSKAMDGSLIPSTSLGQQLATDINVLQAGHATVSGTEHSTKSTLFGKAGDLSHFMSGQATPSLTQSDLGQMLKETDALYKDVGDQHQSKFTSWLKGQPTEVRPLLLDRFNSSRQQYFPSSAVGIAGGAPAQAPSGPVAAGLPGMSPAQAAAPMSYPSDVMDYAKSHGISNDAAMAIKAARGGK